MKSKLLYLFVFVMCFSCKQSPKNDEVNHLVKQIEESNQIIENTNSRREFAIYKLYNIDSGVCRYQHLTMEKADRLCNYFFDEVDSQIIHPSYRTKKQILNDFNSINDSLKLFANINTNKSQFYRTLMAASDSIDYKDGNRISTLVRMKNIILIHEYYALDILTNSLPAYGEGDTPRH